MPNDAPQSERSSQAHATLTAPAVTQTSATLRDLFTGDCRQLLARLSAASRATRHRRIPSGHTHQPGWRTSPEGSRIREAAAAAVRSTTADFAPRSQQEIAQNHFISASYIMLHTQKPT